VQKFNNKFKKREINIEQ